MWWAVNWKINTKWTPISVVLNMNSVKINFKRFEVLVVIYAKIPKLFPCIEIWYRRQMVYSYYDPAFLDLYDYFFKIASSLVRPEMKELITKVTDMRTF